MVEAETAFSFLGQALPVASGGLKQSRGADNIGLDERLGPVDRAVDMRLRGKMHHRVRIESLEDPADRGQVTDIGLLELIAAVGQDLVQARKICRIGQLVEVEDLVPRRPQNQPNDS
jgi:hypothetical protein